jgi:hypothetical protein
MFSATIREKSIGKMRSMRPLAVLLVPMVTLILGVTAPQVWAEDGDEIPFDVAKLFFELNNSDGDLGIHGLIDGEAWKRLEIEDPRERQMLDISVRGRLKKQGLTELFFESAEPTFDELPARKFFRRFPKGRYEIEGVTLEGDELESEVWLSHRIPAPADVTVKGDDIITADECADEEEPEPTEVSLPVVIEWDRVTRSHPNIGWPQDRHIDVVLYQVVVEWEDEDENVFIFNAEFPDSDLVDPMQVTVPEEFLLAAGENEFKIEVLVRAANNNQTAVESCTYILVSP